MSRVDSIEGASYVRFPATQFIVLTLPVVVLALVLGYSYTNLQMDTRLKALTDADTTWLHHMSGFIGAEVSNSLNLLHALSTEDSTIRAVGSKDPRSLQALQNSFLILARRNPNYQQVRWINESGIERVRIMRDQAEPYIVEQQNLQDKSQRYYFKEANELLTGQMYISPVDLNVEHGKVEYPTRTMLRIATPVLDHTRAHRGILVINITMKHLFNMMRNASGNDVETNYILLNQKGEVLASWLKKQSASEPHTQNENFKVSQPAIWERLTNINAGSEERMDGLWLWKTLNPMEVYKRLAQSSAEHSEALQGLSADEFRLTLLIHRPIKALVEMRQEARFLTALMILIGLGVYVVSVFFYLTGHVRTRRAEINSAYALAKASNLARLKELEERFHRLVEASSIGQLVVDEAGNIEISNSSAQEILGYEASELDGLSVDKLLPENKQKQHQQHRDEYLKDPKARKMGVGRRLKAVTKQGHHIPVEIGLNPYTDQGRRLVLVSIIDLSSR